MRVKFIKSGQSVREMDINHWNGLQLNSSENEGIFPPIRENWGWFKRFGKRGD